MKKLFPREIIKRKKYGFTAPVAKWYGEYLYEVASNLFSGSELIKQKIFKSNYIENLLRNSLRNVEKINKVILLLTFEMWYKIFIERTNPKK